MRPADKRGGGSEGAELSAAAGSDGYTLRRRHDTLIDRGGEPPPYPSPNTAMWNVDATGSGQRESPHIRGALIRDPGMVIY